MATACQRVAKLIALSAPPATGPRDEANAAAVKACELIRTHHLSIWDPGDSGTKRVVISMDYAPTDYAEALERNPVRVAVRQRHADRERAKLRKEQAERTVVGA